ncbi:BTB/POZ domain-containing protein [Aspergillus stella-maris]|uniref:BTB/POZ domain-containing protein n=1 Tax=Aspergillus stella-maris TaxID=1810926 RepID=UPI003CCD85DC
MEDIENQKPATGVELPAAQEMGDMAACLKSWYRTAKFTDVTIITPEKEFRVHKLVICSQSGYFARMFSGNWLISETHKNTVKLEGDDSRFVQTMIDFMYGFAYDTTKYGNMSPMMFHVAAYPIADKYDVTKMEEHIKEKFERLVGIYWDMDDLSFAIEEVYHVLPSCERGLRDPLTPEFAADVAKKLFYEGTKFCEVPGSDD